MYTRMALLLLCVALTTPACGSGDSPGWFPADNDSGIDSGEDEDASVDTDHDAAVDTETESGGDTESETEDTGSETEDTETESATEDTEPDCPEGLASYDADGGLCWQITPASYTGTWATAVTYCDGLTLGGYNDWRLALRGEYLGILEGCPETVLDGGNGYCYSCNDSPECAALLGADAAGCYWTGDYLSPTTAYGVCLHDGWTASGPNSNPAGDLRCVRDAD